MKLQGLMLGTVLVVLTTQLYGQPYPAKPVRVIVPFAAGGGTDVVARAIGVKLSEALGQPFVVDNRAGATGAIGAELVAKSVPDGHTLLMGSSGPIVLNPSLQPKLSYDPARDFMPVALITIMPFLMVAHPSLPARSVKELIALARSRPGQLNYASPGSGSSTHLAMELFKAMARIEIVHVPYKGVAPASTDLISGQVQLLAGDLSTLMPHVASSRMRPLAVTGATRSALVPGVPTLAEAGVAGYEASGWFGMLAPAGVAQDIVGRLNTEIVKTMQSDDLRKRLSTLGGELAAGTPEQFGEHLRWEWSKWGKLIRTLNLKADAV
jgi:tripartite-type tricarboxylate transporter receptor subunit TctC